MMVIAFITMKSGLVPLIEGLCAQILYLRFEIIGGHCLRSHLLLFFVERKNMLKKKSNQFKISSRLLAYTFKCVLCTHMRIHICRDSVHLDSSGPPGVLSQPLGSNPSTPYVQCVCVCAYIHTYYTYTHIHSHPRQKLRRRRQHHYLFFCQKQPPTPSNKCPYTLVGLLHPRSPTLNEQTAHT